MLHTGPKPSLGTHPAPPPPSLTQLPPFPLVQGSFYNDNQRMALFNQWASAFGKSYNQGSEQSQKYQTFVANCASSERRPVQAACCAAAPSMQPE